MTNIKTVFPPCPHCGKDDDFIVNRRAFGWYRSLYSCEDGQHYLTDNDRVGMSDSKTIRCGACNKVRRDVKFAGDVVCINQFILAL